MESKFKAGLVCIFIVVVSSPSNCDNNTKTTVAPTKQTTTLTPEQECALLNSSCSDCVDNSKCMYCYSTDECMLYPAGKILPPESLCPLDKARWGTCLVNFKALIISMSVIGGVILLTVAGCCIYCCCCRGRKGKRYEREDAKFESQKMERKARQEERRSERRSRLDEIRMKYGLMKDDSAPYSRFDA